MSIAPRKYNPKAWARTDIWYYSIMVLCPFVFIYTKPDLPQLQPQPTEVASTHWVPLRCLLSPSTRTYEYVDVSDRFARQGGPVIRTLISSVLGRMRFSAVRLVPSESLYCSTTAEFFSPPEDIQSGSPKKALSRRFYSWYLGDHAGSADRGRPLLLWGLTLGILADFLDQLPPHTAVKLWSYPTFTSLDTRFIIDLLTLRLKARNAARLQGKGRGAENQTAIDSETEATAVSGDNPWFIGGLSEGMKCVNEKENRREEYAIGIMLDGYYDMARRGVWISAATRAIATIALSVYVVRKYRRWS